MPGAASNACEPDIDVVEVFDTVYHDITPDLARQRDELLAELARSGPRTVTELRRFAATSTVYRAADANRALASLLAAGAVTRDPEHGRLGGAVVVSAAPGGDAGSAA